MRSKTGLVFIICLMVESTLSIEWTETADCTSGTVVIQHIHAYRDTGNGDCGDFIPGIEDIREQCLCKPTCTFILYTGPCTDVNVTFACDQGSCLDTSTTKTDVTTMTSAAPAATSAVGINASSTAVAGGSSTSVVTVVTSSISNSTISTEHESQYAPARTPSPGLIAGVSVAGVTVVGVGVVIVCTLVRRRRMLGDKNGSAFARQSKQSLTSDVPTTRTSKSPNNTYLNVMSEASPYQNVPDVEQGPVPSDYQTLNPLRPDPAYSALQTVSSGNQGQPASDATVQYQNCDFK